MRLTRKTHLLLLALLVGAPMAANCGGTAAPTTHNDASVPTGGAGATRGTPNTAGKTGAGSFSKWYTDYGKAFKIQVSTDSTTWTDVYSTTVGASYSVTDVTFTATTARYVRMYGTQRGNQNGYSLFAFVVLNGP